MVRENTIGVRLNDDEVQELKDRAEQHHLKLSSYCRWFLFNAGLFVQSKGEPIERISRGIPKRIQSEHKIMDLHIKKEVMNEMKNVFENGIKLKKVKLSEINLIIENRKKTPEITLDELKFKRLSPPK